jgi:large subunit ribosomal protein L22
MQVQAILSRVNMSAQKMREVVRQIQGLPAVQAQAVLAVVPRKSARFVAKTLDAAMANAEDLRRQWKDATLKTKVMELRGKIENTKDHKRRNKYKWELSRYEDFLDSANKLKVESLRVKEAVAGQASTIKRFTPKARGSAGPILKRYCHIKIVLSDE